MPWNTYVILQSHLLSIGIPPAITSRVTKCRTMGSLTNNTIPLIPQGEKCNARNVAYTHGMSQINNLNTPCSLVGETSGPASLFSYNK